MSESITQLTTYARSVKDGSEIRIVAKSYAVRDSIDNPS